MRGLEIEGRFIKFTRIGVYLEAAAVPWLAVNWKGKTPDELAGSVGFFRDIVRGELGRGKRMYTASSCCRGLGSGH